MKKYLSDIGLLTVGLLWGLGFLGVKITLNGGTTPFVLLSVRFLGCFVLLLLVFFKTIIKINKKEIKAGIILGTLLCMGFIFLMHGANNTTTSKNAIFISLNVIIIPYIYWIVNKKRPSIFSFAASIICFLGIFIMSVDKNMQWTNLNLGDILTMISTIFFSLQLVFANYYTKTGNPIRINIVQMLVAGIWSTLLVFISKYGFNKNEVLSLSGYDTILALIYVVVFSTTVAYILQISCQKNVPSPRASILLGTESVFAPVFACIFLGDTLTQKLLLGGGLILFAVVLSETKLGIKINNRKSVTQNV